MHDTLPLFGPTTFPSISRNSLEILQINIGLRCNLACLHCHTNSNTYRKEAMSDETIQHVIDFLESAKIGTLDITGGAPELHPLFRELVVKAKSLGVLVMDRCNLTVLEEPGYTDLYQFLAENEVEIVASLPCYTESNVDQQRGKGVFDTSINVLQKLNSLGYGKSESHLKLNLVYNPVGPFLPPSQAELEITYKKELSDNFGIEFDQLFTLTNMPIKRFGNTLVSKGQFDEYMGLLINAHQDKNTDNVMCRSLLSVDWQGYVYDCDFNQMLGLPMENSQKTHLSELLNSDLYGRKINVRNHCYGCTAGQGSSCGGALTTATGN